MLGFKLAILLTACLSWSHCKQDKYCSVCEDHTLCKYQGIGKSCTDVGEGGVSEKDKQEILDVHNWLRSIVAAGHEARGTGDGQPKAANLRKLIWDVELERVAQRWADQCTFQHDHCRNDPRWNVGQNIYWKWKFPNHFVNWTEAITSWYNEVSQYNPKEVEAYRFEAATGHYTQMLWHDTYAIGCGRRDYGKNKLYVCNYGPAGNWIGEPLYTIGEPCSKCPQGTVCEEFLCALPKDIKNQLANRNLDEDSGTEVTTPRLKNETNHLEVLHPPEKNADNVYAVETPKAKPCKITTSSLKIAVDEEKQNLNDVFLASEEQLKTKNKIGEDNDFDLEADIKKGIEDIKQRIEQLVKSVIKKHKAKH